MADPRWTDETERLLVERNHEAECGGPIDDCVFLREHGEAARDSLVALADAGLLLPPGGQASEQQRGYWNPLTAQVQTWWSNYNSGYKKPDRIRKVTTWLDGSVLIGPWTEVTS